MTILLDTNIIMDALQERQPFDASAKELLLRAQNGEFKCCFTANAATDIFYLYSRARDISAARSALGFLFSHYDIVAVTYDDCVNALSLPIDDFEDALVVACAERADVDYIVTRDDDFLRMPSNIALIRPDEFLGLL